jgi:hypothetical protein
MTKHRMVTMACSWGNGHIWNIPNGNLVCFGQSQDSIHGSDRVLLIIERYFHANESLGEEKTFLTVSSIANRMIDRLQGVDIEVCKWIDMKKEGVKTIQVCARALLHNISISVGDEVMMSLDVYYKVLSTQILLEILLQHCSRLLKEPATMLQ